MIAAQRTAHDIALTQGEFTPTDEALLANTGSGLKSIRDYLVPFVMPEQTGMPSDVPGLGLSTMPRLKGLGFYGRDAYLSNISGVHDVVANGTEWPAFGSNFNLPVLLDPQTYSPEEFASLTAENADGYAQQVIDTWRSIVESERDNPSFTSAPRIIRAVAVLLVRPAGALPEGACEYAVDFLPQLAKAPADVAGKVPRAYDVRLLVKGSENLGANYLKYEFGDKAQSVYADADGNRAPLTVSRGQKVGEPTSVEELGLTPRSQGAIALYVAPHIIKQKAAPRALPLEGYGSADTLMGLGSRNLTMSKGLGSAHVEVGPASTWIGSGKREDGIIDRVAPELQGQPTIFSVQLLTFER